MEVQFDDADENEEEIDRHSAGDSGEGYFEGRRDGRNQQEAQGASQVVGVPLTQSNSCNHRATSANGANVHLGLDWHVFVFLFHQDGTSATGIPTLRPRAPSVVSQSACNS